MTDHDFFRDGFGHCVETIALERRMILRASSEAERQRRESHIGRLAALFLENLAAARKRIGKLETDAAINEVSDELLRLGLVSYDELRFVEESIGAATGGQQEEARSGQLCFL